MLARRPNDQSGRRAQPALPGCVWLAASASASVMTTNSTPTQLGSSPSEARHTALSKSSNPSLSHFRQAISRHSVTAAYRRQTV